jgi:hypothetical protein
MRKARILLGGIHKLKDAYDTANGSLAKVPVNHARVLLSAKKRSKEAFRPSLRPSTRWNHLAVTACKVYTDENVGFGFCGQATMYNARQMNGLEGR